MWWLNTDDSNIKEKTLPEWLLMCNYNSSLCSARSGSPTAAWVTWSLCLKPIPFNMSGKFSASFLTHFPVGGHRTESVLAFSEDRTARCKNRKNTSTEMAHIPMFSLSDHKIQIKLRLLYYFIFRTGHFEIQRLQRHCKDNLSGTTTIP